ncbi:MAG TPA: Smr/MutS family protein [Burkholderiaceae bacterium]|nr:Smr/MutS family protein [Burkholderiaceae bacterium]
MRLKDFEALKQAMRSRERDAALRREHERQAALQRERALRESGAREQFVQAVGPVQALRPHGRADLARPRPLPHPRQRELDERAALQEALSDEVDVETLLLTDDGLSFHRPGIGPDVVARLRRGHWSIQAEVDLHGLRRDEARAVLADFVRAAGQRGLRCLRVIHGKGLGSPGREPVLKAKVQRWLAQTAGVIAFAQASAPQGGAGALIVLLAG